MAARTIIGDKNKTPMRILDKPIHDQQALDTIHKEVGKKIKQQGGNMVLCVFVDPEVFKAFKRMNPAAERFIHELKDAATLRKHRRAEVMCLGAFWTHPQWDSIFTAIQEKTNASPFIRVNWFPMMGRSSGFVTGFPSERR